MNAWVVEAGDVCWLRADVALAAAARREAGQLARGICLPAETVGRMELCVTEMATNLLKHAHDGSLALRVARGGGRVAVECLSLDNGPGIQDLAGAMRDGTSGTGTLGIGLGAIGRLADAFGVHSLPGRGTVVFARFWTDTPSLSPIPEPAAAVLAPPPAPAAGLGGVVSGGLTRPISGEQVCGDTWAIRAVGDEGRNGSLMMMCDGLGHGPLAARVADRAREAFRESRHTSPVAVLEDVHRHLRGTRGAAAAIALVDVARGRVELAGAGNITAAVVTDDTRVGLLSMPGIVGAHMPRPRMFETPWPPGAVLVLHSDGLSDRWKPADFPGLFGQDPAMIAGQLLNQMAVRRDDAGIAVAVHRGP
ncbi:SpoIIE family protein phosphatase [Streptomyces sp. LP11]|uniref:SpoIIE family protein phosphatase n=1 Tax=Streptomyces pyxinicus TaxID=2970331 RepID=A0ABT2B915_9ACTN|nr:SpoIIE family protein phosphatase [Streptomyces sp. LP11]MCS0604398.1 SpoIIE family protein phosphatase [Streptomyces sp. LP11]